MPDPNLILSPGDTIGILGGGQLGRMIALAAARLGLRTHIFCPDADSPAFDVAHAFTRAPYDDRAALSSFAASVEVITYEFENVPVETVAFLETLVPVRPGAHSLALSQDRLTEKSFLVQAGVPVAPHAAVSDAADLEAALTRIGGPGILKTRRFGYDGKGQTRIAPGEDAVAALARLGNRPSILEGFVPFVAECSAVVARGLDGSVAAFDIAENVHIDHILKWSRVPAPSVPAATQAKARQIGATVAAALGHVGVLCVEFFVVHAAGETRLIANEIAPRVHNSGHWSEDGALTSQFEQHVRAVAGWPLGSPATRAPTEMENLIGADADDWATILASPEARLHLYGKRETRAGRKMGHVNRPLKP
ncbi:5-(carboxyamino)imidazole ribonucleotide synthase [Segnochrobactraceae bacterium EtOH-i3]